MAAPKHRSRFLSTPSARRATLGGVCFFLCAVISIHALCEEGDSTPARRRSWLIYFYPRPLRGGRPSPSRLTPSSCYFYPRPLRGGRPDAGPARLIDLLGISIHALCEEGDVSAPFIKHSHKIFLSTPSARRATGEQRAPVARSQISIHALCEEGDRLLWDEPKIFFLISIHALCEEGDSLLLRPFIGLLLFLSTPSARRATPSSSASFLMSIISIHALCEEGDRILWKNFKRFMGISIHALCEEGDVSQNHNNTWSKSISIHALCEEGDFWSSARFCGASVFLSTPSARRATRLPGGLGRVPNISIHALCEEGDVVVVVVGSVEMLFLSTPSARRATQRQHHLRRRRGISIHALCEEGDRRSGCTSQLTQRFLSTPSARRATRCTCPEAVAAYEFLSTPSARRATKIAGFTDCC